MTHGRPINAHFDPWRDMLEFYQTYDLLPPAGPPTWPEDNVIGFRLKFLSEELVELHEAIQERRLVGVFDALIDLVYVALGTAVEFRLPFPTGWDEVHSANLRKVRVESATDSKRAHPRDVVKPHDFVEPNLERILRQEAEVYRGE